MPGMSYAQSAGSEGEQAFFPKHWRSREFSYKIIAQGGKRPNPVPDAASLSRTGRIIPAGHIQ